MFNALNSLSENESLATVPPWTNKLLLAAIALSFALHFAILYVPWLAAVFSVAPITFKEWLAVIWLSFVVVVLDEWIKFFSRRLVRHGALGSATRAVRLSSRSTDDDYLERQESLYKHV